MLLKYLPKRERERDSVFKTVSLDGLEQLLITIWNIGMSLKFFPRCECILQLDLVFVTCITYSHPLLTNSVD